MMKNTTSKKRAAPTHSMPVRATKRSKSKAGLSTAAENTSYPTPTSIPNSCSAKVSPTSPPRSPAPYSIDRSSNTKAKTTTPQSSPRPSPLGLQTDTKVSPISPPPSPTPSLVERPSSTKISPSSPPGSPNPSPVDRASSTQESPTSPPPSPTQCTTNRASIKYAGNPSKERSRPSSSFLLRAHYICAPTEPNSIDDWEDYDDRIPSHQDFVSAIDNKCWGLTDEDLIEEREWRREKEWMRVDVSGKWKLRGSLLRSHLTMSSRDELADVSGQWVQPSFTRGGIEHDVRVLLVSDTCKEEARIIRRARHKQ